MCVSCKHYLPWSWIHKVRLTVGSQPDTSRNRDSYSDSAAYVVCNSGSCTTPVVVRRCTLAAVYNADLYRGRLADLTEFIFRWLYV